MRLKHDVSEALLSITKLSKTKLRSEFLFSKELEIFKGHFPNKPILPGVYMLESIMLTLKMGYGIDVGIKQAREVKFGKLVFPPCRIYVTTELLKTGLDYNIDGRVICKEEQVAYTFLNAAIPECESIQLKSEIAFHHFEKTI